MGGGSFIPFPIDSGPQRENHLDERPVAAPLAFTLDARPEIAQAIVFLASSNAAFVTGEIVHVNGGKTAF
jgi:NAD(P)-dependent dehydrogenase (short-subunit alcohol dehydrogenase family)